MIHLVAVSLPALIALLLGDAAAVPTPPAAEAPADAAGETVVTATTPLHGSRLPRDHVPANVQTVTADATARKVAALRIFPGRTPMDLTIADVGGACLVVSQFTLCAALGKGNRPSFEPAAEPAVAEPLYLRVAAALRATGLPVETGRFGADMQVALVNDGPVTLILET